MKVRIKKRGKEKKPRPIKNSPRYWMAMGTLAAYTTVGAKTPTTAYAQHIGSIRNETGPAQSLLVQRFDIPPDSDPLPFVRDVGYRASFSIGVRPSYET